MRSQFKGHFGESTEVVDRIWNSGTFVFDANVLLNLYRYSESAREEFLTLMSSIEERCWLPEQCGHEYLTNRLSVVREQMKSYTDIEGRIVEIERNLAASKGHPFISDQNFKQLLDVLESIKGELSQSCKAQEERLTKDNLKDRISDIFEGRVGSPFSEEELDQQFVEAERRYQEAIPPGYKDAKKHPDASKRSDKKSKFGDYLLWRQTLDWAKANQKEVIFVTDDQKEDWWLIASGKIVSARPELISEFHEETGGSILFYSPDRFLQLAQEKLDLKVSSDTLEEVREEGDNRGKAQAWNRLKDLDNYNRWMDSHGRSKADRILAIQSRLNDESDMSADSNLSSSNALRSLGKSFDRLQALEERLSANRKEQVALELLNREFEREGEGPDQEVHEQRARLRTEARALVAMITDLKGSIG